MADGDSPTMAVEQMDTDDVQQEYTTLREESLSGVLPDDQDERMEELWQELRSRTDVEQPECPECDARNWGFSDHIICRECGSAPPPEADELRQDILVAWETMMHGDTSE